MHLERGSRAVYPQPVSSTDVISMLAQGSQYKFEAWNRTGGTFLRVPDA